MENRPKGREKHVSGDAKGAYKKGEGLGTGPVGREDGYEGRRKGSSASGTSKRSSGERAGGSGGGLNLKTVIIALLVLFLGGGGFSLSSLLGSLGGGGGDLLGSLFQSSSQSSGWVQTANTGKLNTSVASGAREKRTQILGNGQDIVTIMVYMCGTDLESKHGMASSDLQEMANANIGKNVNVLVYTGGCAQWKNNVVSNQVNQVYKVEQGGVKCLVQNDGRDSLTKPSTLTKFIQYGTKNYPANRYELILWDHGGGSVSGFGYDEKNTTSGSMTLKGIDQALRNAGVTFDFIGFDACLMATLENGLMLDKYADYLIASEETEPGVGWYYTDWLTKLSANTSMPTVEIGQNIVDDFVRMCDQKCAGQKTTLSVVDLAELSATVPDTFKSFASSTSNLLQNDGYQIVSDARSQAREFAPSNKIDQVDVVHLAYNMNTDEGKALADAVLGAVKYNKTSSNMTNAYGLSIYFPYKKTSTVDSAVATYQAIGLDGEYARCIQQFASLEVSGQAASGGSQSPFPSLFGDGASVGGGDITQILGGLLGGNFGGVEGLTAGNTDFLSAFLDVDRAAAFVSEHRLDASQLVWKEKDGKTLISLSEDQWSLVHELQLNVFLDDGEGYIDLGLDNVYDFTDDGDLLGEYDGTWLAIDSQVVPYYYTDSLYEGDNYTITGRVPVLLNGERANLILVFDNTHPYGYIAGARYDYVDGETQTVAKGITELEAGDKLEFLCDYYAYDGTYQDSYRFGEPMTYTGNHEISNVRLNQKTVASYLFTDIYCQEHWTPVIP